MPNGTAGATRAPGLNLKGAMLKYSIQSGLLWIAWCPLAYASTFMLGRDLSATEAGFALAIGNLLALVVNPFVASAADGKGTLDIRTMSVGLSAATVVTMAVATVSRVPVVMMGGIALGYMFAQNLPALSNSINVYYVNRGARINYGLARGIGSLTWSITSAILGFAMAAFGTDVIMVIGFGANVAMTVGFMLMPTPKDVPALFDPDADADDSEEAVEAREGSYGAFLRDNPRFLRLIVGFSLCFFMGQLIANYAPLIVEQIGGDSTVQGNALAIQAACELPAMWTMDLLTRRIRVANIIRFAAAGYVAKHGMIMFAVLAGSIPLLYVGYGLQAVSYAVYTAACVYYCNASFGEGDKNKALGLCVMVNTISGILGSFFGGIIVDAFGVNAMLAVGVGLTVAGALIAFTGVERAREAGPAAEAACE